MRAAIVVLLVAFVQGKQDPNKDCEEYAYCQGRVFATDMDLRGKHITCDNVPEPRKRCCLPQAPHFVCYNINVGGQFLNYQPEITERSTNISGLCRELVNLQGDSYRPGRQVSATLSNEGGYTVWRNNKWIELAQHSIGNQHIRTLSCSYEEVEA